MTRSDLLNGALGLPLDERIRLVEEVWESIAEMPDAVELTPAQRAELDSRLAARQQGTWRGSPWETVKARILEGRTR